MSKKEQNTQTEFEWSELGDLIKEGDVDDIDKDALQTRDKTMSDIFALYNADGFVDYLRTKNKTETLQYGLHKGKPQYSQIHTGSGKTVLQLDGWQTSEYFKDLFKKEPEHIKEYSNSNVQMLIGTDADGPKTGKGKSYSLAVFIEIMMWVRNIPPENVYTNIEGWYNDIPDNKDDLLALLRNQGEHSIVGLDEAAQFLQYADMTYGKEISQASKMARHNNTHMFYVPHTGKDLPKDIRMQCICVMKHDDKTGMVGYNLIEDASGKMTPQENLFEFIGMPIPNNPPPQAPNIIIPNPEAEEVHKCYVQLESGKRCPNHAVQPDVEPLVCTNHTNLLEDAYRNKLNGKWEEPEEQYEKLKQKYKEDEEQEEVKPIWEEFGDLELFKS